MVLEVTVMSLKVWCCAFLCLVLSLPVFGQRIAATVEVVLDKLPVENQEKLGNLQEELDRYLNRHTWCQDDYGYEVPVTVSVYFEEAKATSREDRYEARLIISNESDVQYSDYRWDFAMDPNPRLEHSTVYDSFTGMVEFYLYLILGFEFDRLEKLGGRDYFQKARDVVEQAKFGRFIRGWDRREDILVQILSDDNVPNREMKFYYYTGTYYYQFGELEDAIKYLAKAISYFEQLPKEAMERFYSLNYHQMGTALGRLGMKDQLELLTGIDEDQEHRALYRQEWEAIGAAPR
jgi:tetratricopeptide (TPR) repeat protein